MRREPEDEQMEREEARFEGMLWAALVVWGLMALGLLGQLKGWW